MNQYRCETCSYFKDNNCMSISNFGVWLSSEERMQCYMAKQMVKKLSLFSEPSGSLPEEGNDSVYRRGYSVLTSCAESVSTACPVCAYFRCVKHLKIPGATVSRCDRGHWTGGTGYQFLYLERRERRNKYGKKNNPI